MFNRERTLSTNFANFTKAFVKFAKFVDSLSRCLRAFAKHPLGAVVRPYSNRSAPTGSKQSLQLTRDGLQDTRRAIQSLRSSPTDGPLPPPT